MYVTNMFTVVILSITLSYKELFTKKYNFDKKIKGNKRPMGHIAHRRKQFKSINTYDYIITFIKRRKKILTL